MYVSKSISVTAYPFSVLRQRAVIRRNTRTLDVANDK